MRTLLAVASVALLVGAGFGCGDDTTTTPVADMTAVADMTVPHDMMTINCSQIFTCAANCTTQACISACIAEGKAASQTKASALLQCALGACMVDGGVDTACISSTIGNGLAGNGVCASQGTACSTDT